MPVSSTADETFAINTIVVDMKEPALTVGFAHVVGGAQLPDVPYLIVGDAFNAIFGVPADATVPRAVDLANALYNAAIAAGVISGTVS